MESWALQTQSGQGFDHNVSMFERLIKGGLSHAALGVQHRMHPDISRLVRPTYKQVGQHVTAAHVTAAHWHYI